MSSFPALRSYQGSEAPSSTAPPSTRAPSPALDANAWESEYEEKQADFEYGEHPANSDGEPMIEDLPPPNPPAPKPPPSQEGPHSTPAPVSGPQVHKATPATTYHRSLPQYGPPPRTLSPSLAPPTHHDQPSQHGRPPPPSDNGPTAALLPPTPTKCKSPRTPGHPRT